MYRGRAGWRLVAADFKQVECRVLAHAARDEHLEQALRSDDLFTDLAARWSDAYSSLSPQCLGES